jgi:hypothetical protein
VKTILVSFANEKFYRSQQVLVESSKKYFSGHASYTKDLLDEQFKIKNKKILEQSRGCGYWLWKPYIIQKTLSLLQQDDIVFYIDSGNLIINDPKPLFTLCSNDEKGIILFENRDGAPAGTIWKNYMWTKQDCFEAMDCTKEKYILGDQVDGSYVLVRKNKFSQQFFDEYLQWCEKDEIITDKISISPNHSEFKDHRHDQSILSILAIKHNVTIAREPSEWGNNYITSKYNYPQIFQHHRGLI